MLMEILPMTYLFHSGQDPADFEWQDALIYMVMTDRFVNGNTSNDEPMVGAAQGLIGRAVTLQVLRK